ncbi:NAD(P)H-dependent oxidoreductase [Limosilactobacillus sp. STM2_1]|uniref:NAD(P)H-dependent oxidoreductase n=1 Tax=Limosilactobacillus rudii TaxID=2759755 RepID=A0A7W3YLZ2_9LACO|nr:NADPH-dependent FMN reductase [Limosilactobacillus rudii]MBB1078428.1 NAD(P)H-dependent oxidoreductase [Limosilactobacillus rudii]MBB1096558.1 NAD(P)H-dependent oxidoreductase [Limosilactobacillus rudii]MCD7134246.1 NAD(P)H-dependent oxidoreductase [Limosilactobacillus rudii]
MKKVGIIVGSVRPNRRSSQVASWLKMQLKESARVQFDIIDLKKIDLPMMDEPNIPYLGMYLHEKTRKWSKLIQSYDGFIFVFPQYNWGYPAVLKNAIDYLGKEWQGKPVSMVTFGGHGGSQAQIAMKLVITGLKMRPLSVNMQINMMPADSTATADRILNTYNPQAILLRIAFDEALK